MSKSSKIVKLCVAGGVLGLATAGGVWRGPQLYAKWFDRQSGQSKESAVRYVTVTRGELRVVVSEDGKLRAVKNHSIFPELRGSCKITWLAAEAAKVSKGDLLVTFDKKTFEDALQARTADLENAMRALTIAEEGVKIQEKISKSNQANARTRLEDAETALKIYKEMEGPKKLAESDNLISDTRTKMTTATKTLSDAQAKLSGEIFIEEKDRPALEKELNNAKVAANTSRTTYESALRARKSFRAYDYPQSMRVKQAAVENAKLDLERAEVAAKSELLQKQAEAAKIREQIVRLKKDIATQEDSLKKCEIRAPVDGLVIYGNANQEYYGGGGREIKVGTDWYGGNVLMTIPDLSAFEVDFKIPEEARGKLKVGCPAKVELQAVPGLVLSGTLKKIGEMGQGRVQWDQNSPRVYSATVALDGHDPRLVSGMSGRVEIVADVVPDVLLVPVEAVINDNGKSVCYVKTAAGQEKRSVKPGKTNDHFVEIVEGLAEGDQVDLTPVADAADSKRVG